MNWQTVEDQCLGDNKFFAQLAGVWPNQKRFVKFSVRLVIFIIVTVAIITEVSRVVVFYSTDVLLDQMAYLSLAMMILAKQYNFILNEKKLNEVLTEIVTDRLMERPREELRILNTYYKKAIILCTIYKASISSVVLMFLCIPAIPPILNIIAPLNESRDREFVYPAYYFVDEQRYYYPILAHMVSMALALAVVYIACDINLIHMVQHGCALLTICGYRFKHAMDDANLCDERYSDTLMSKTYAKVCRSIEAHKKAIKYVGKIDVCYMHYFFLVLGFIMMALTFTFVRISMMELGTRYFIFWMFIAAQLIHLLFVMIMGQFVVNSNDKIFRTIYEAKWYDGPSKTQLLYVLALRKCLNLPVLTGGGLVPLNLYTFIQVLKASFSYYTVINSR